MDMHVCSEFRNLLVPEILKYSVGMKLIQNIQIEFVKLEGNQENRQRRACVNHRV